MGCVENGQEREEEENVTEERNEESMEARLAMSRTPRAIGVMKY